MQATTILRPDVAGWRQSAVRPPSDGAAADARVAIGAETILLVEDQARSK
jgi:hypothetical protein